MKKFLMIGLILGTVAIVAGCSQQTPTPQQPQSKNTPATTQTPASSTTTPTVTASGKDVFDKNCSGCHGAAGVGASTPSLNTEKRSQASVLSIVKKGQGSMPGYEGKLSEAELQAVSQYVVDLMK